MSSIYLLQKDQEISWEQSDYIKFTKCRGQQGLGHNGDHDIPSVLPVQFRPRSVSPMFTVLEEGVYTLELQLGVNGCDYPGFSCYVSLDAEDNRSGIMMRITKNAYEMHQDRMLRTFRGQATAFLRPNDYIITHVHNKASESIKLLAGETYLKITKVK